MRYLALILIILCACGVRAQVRYPTGFPTQFNTGWNRWGYAQSDSGLIIANRDTTFLPKFSGTVVYRPTNKQFYWFDSTNLTWHLFGTNIDTTSLSNRINLKLNIVDTTNKWWSVNKRFVDTVYRVNDSTIGFTINNGAQQTFQILGRSQGGGGGTGTVTSVALSMPSAFSVSGSPITSSGTFNVSGAGTTAQYIRGNGTLATTDTGMIPNFYLKVRSLISATSPLSYNSSTGVLNIANANTSGQKGAATFLNSDFSDNGSGLISLSTLVSNGSCTNCSVTFGADGRATAYSTGTGPSGVSVDTIFRIPGIDSIYFNINGTQYAITDSTWRELVNNGISKNGDTVQLGAPNTSGSPLNHNTWVNTAGFTLTVQGASSTGNVLEGINTNTGSGIYGSSVSLYGVQGNSDNLYGVYGTSGISNAIRGWTTNGNTAAYLENTASSTNTVTPTLQLKRTTSGTAAAGIGSSIEWFVEKDNGANNTQSHTLRSILTTATNGSEVGQFELYGVNNAVLARKFAVTGTGQWIWDGYPSLTAQTDSSTYKPIAIDGSGNVVRMSNWFGSGGGGSGITALTGDVNASGSGSVAATISANAVTDPKFRQSAGLSAVGRSANSTGNVADITASTDSTVLSRLGSSLAFRVIDSNLLKATTVAPGSYTLANITVGRDGRIYAVSNGSVGGVPTLDAVLTAGNVAANKNITLSRYSGGQIKIDVWNYDTTDNNDVARIDLVSHRGKAVTCTQAPDSTDNEHQYFWYFTRPGTWDVIDSTKAWVIGTVGRNPDNPTSLWRGFRLINVYKGNLSVFNADSLGRIGLAGITAPTAWLDLPAGSGYAGLRIRPETGTPSSGQAGDIHNIGTGDQITFTGMSGTVYPLVNQPGNLADGVFSGSGPYTFAPSLTFVSNTSAGIGYNNTTHEMVFSSSSSTAGSFLTFNSDASGLSGGEFRDNNFVLRGNIGVLNSATSRYSIMANTGTSVDIRANGISDNDPDLRVTSGNRIFIKGLDTDNSPPSTSGTTKMVITDANAQLSFADIPSGGGITSINSQTGASQTLAADNGLTATTTTNTVTYTLGGTLTGFTQIAGGSNSLLFGTSGSHLSGFTTYGDAINLFGNVRYGVEDYSTDANHTVPSTITFEELHDVLSTNRTLTMPSASQQGQTLTIVTRFSAGSNHFNLASAITDNSTGSTFTQLDWGKRYDFYVNSSLAWILISKY